MNMGHISLLNSSGGAGIHNEDATEDVRVLIAKELVKKAKRSIKRLSMLRVAQKPAAAVGVGSSTGSYIKPICAEES